MHRAFFYDSTREKTFGVHEFSDNLESELPVIVDGGTWYYNISL